MTIQTKTTTQARIDHLQDLLYDLRASDFSPTVEWQARVEKLLTAVVDLILITAEHEGSKRKPEDTIQEEHLDIFTLPTKRVGFVTARMARMEEFDLTDLDPDADPCTVVVERYRHVDSETIECILQRVSP